MSHAIFRIYLRLSESQGIATEQVSVDSKNRDRIIPIFFVMQG